MVSVIIFSVVVLSLAGLSFQVAKHSTRAMDQTYVMGQLFQRVDRAATIRYDSLSHIVACDTTVRGLVKIIGCTSVASISGTQSTVTMTVKTTVPSGRTDTIIMTRSTGRKTLPLR